MLFAGGGGFEGVTTPTPQKILIIHHALHVYFVLLVAFLGERPRPGGSTNIKCIGNLFSKPKENTFIFRQLHFTH